MSPWEDFDRDSRRYRRALEARPVSWGRYAVAVGLTVGVSVVWTLALPEWWGLAPSIVTALVLSWWVYRG